MLEVRGNAHEMCIFDNYSGHQSVTIFVVDLERGRERGSEFKAILLQEFNASGLLSLPTSGNAFEQNKGSTQALSGLVVGDHERELPFPALTKALSSFLY